MTKWDAQMRQTAAHLELRACRTLARLAQEDFARLQACVASLLALMSGRTWLIAEREIIAHAEALLWRCGFAPPDKFQRRDGVEGAADQRAF